MFCPSLQVKAHPSVSAHMLHDLDDVKKSSTTEPTLLLIDIAGYANYLNHMKFCFLVESKMKIHWSMTISLLLSVVFWLQNLLLLLFSCFRSIFDVL